jgi:5-methyltetrahydrofolate--homocysteine methyltransferase
VSFGLPPAGREVLNAVFLYHCVQAGLDLAIVNSEKLERYVSIPEEERRLAEDLIWWRGDEPIAAFAAHFRAKSPKATVEERLDLPSRTLAAASSGHEAGPVRRPRRGAAALQAAEIINGPLMAGMDEVGHLFRQQRDDRRRGAAVRRGHEGCRTTSSRTWRRPTARPRDASSSPR